MSEEPISISNLNDFIFCPVSIYFHSLEDDTDTMIFQDSCQINGTHAHEKSDLAAYSSKTGVLQGVGVYCDRYDICGKIDTFDIETGTLTERKKKIKTVYDGYVFQVYAQYFSLEEMGYSVKELRLYSMDDNKVYRIEKPETNPGMLKKFEDVIFNMKNFSFNNFEGDNKAKCSNCIYEPLCSFSALK